MAYNFTSFDENCLAIWVSQASKADEKQNTKQLNERCTDDPTFQGQLKSRISRKEKPYHRGASLAGGTEIVDLIR